MLATSFSGTERPDTMLKFTIKVFEDVEAIGEMKFKRNRIFNAADNSLVTDTNDTSIGNMDTNRPFLGRKAKQALGNILAEEKARISKLINDEVFAYLYVNSDGDDIGSDTKMLVDNFIELSVITFHVWICKRLETSLEIPVWQRERNTTKIQAYVRRFFTARHVSKCMSNSGTDDIFFMDDDATVISNA